MRTTVPLGKLHALVNGRYGNPSDILGAHEVEADGRKAVSVRAFLPRSKQVWLIDPGHDQPRPMRRIHPAGFFEALCPWQPNDPNRRYQFRTTDESGQMTVLDDPYTFHSILTDFDHYLLGEGRHYRSYDRLGAHLRSIDGVAGVNFAVWAPNATAVSVIGDFNYWDARQHPMRTPNSSGIWELFIPGLGVGEKYKFSIETRYGGRIEKADPFAFECELPPNTASVVADINVYQWNDDAWLQRRSETNWLDSPIACYEVHLGSWRRNNGEFIGYRETAHQLVEYCQKMGFTHLELLPVSEHPFFGSWGYQPIGYFAPTSRFGTPEDFMYFVDYCHQHGLGVIIDWVPAHFPRDAHGLRCFDGSALYEHEDPRQGEHPDWGTMVFNYGRNEVRNFLVANSLFWLDKYHIDGLRVDAVASMLYLDYSRKDGEWIPNKYGGRENLEAIDMLREFNCVAHREFPGVLTIAEESTAWGGVSRPTDVGGLGFSMKWNMGWMNDTLRYMRHDPIHRRFHHGELTFSLIYAFTENFVLPLSHDEVVHQKGALLDQMPGDLWQKFANLRLLYSYMWTHPGKKLLFMGGEIGQWHEWNHDDEIQWDLLQFDTHQGVQNLVADLNAMYRAEPSLYEHDFVYTGFEWMDCDNGDDSVLAYVRRAKDGNDLLLICCNFTPVVRHNFRIPAPVGGKYREIFNSDSLRYGGSDVGNPDGVMAEAFGMKGKPYSVNITLPPLAIMVFKPEPKTSGQRN